jgi:hypothetical protein
MNALASRRDFILFGGDAGGQQAPIALHLSDRHDVAFDFSNLRSTRT